MAGKLTHSQLRVLRGLAEMHRKHPANTYGFNPTFMGPLAAAICRRALAPKGLVHLNRIQGNHIRYFLTGEGWVVVAVHEAA